MGHNQIILADLKAKLRKRILKGIDYEIDYCWSGIMGKSSTKEPISKSVSPGVVLLAGFGGMGVALAPFMAKKLVDGL